MQKAQKNTNNLSPRWNHRKHDWEGFLEVIQVSLENCQERKFTTSLVNLFQYLTSLTMEESRPYIHWNFCLVAGKFFSCHFTAHIWCKHASLVQSSILQHERQVVPSSDEVHISAYPSHISNMCGSGQRRGLKNQLKLAKLLNENKSAVFPQKWFKGHRDVSNISQFSILWNHFL